MDTGFGEETQQFMAFNAGGTKYIYAVPMENIYKVIAVGPDTRRAAVPRQSKGVSCVISLDDELLTVVDLVEGRREPAVMVLVLVCGGKRLGLLGQSAGLVDGCLRTVAEDRAADMKEEVVECGECMCALLDVPKLYREFDVL